MKRRTQKLNERRKKRETRLAEQYQSKGNSPYAKKQKAGQMYGPARQIPKYPDCPRGKQIREQQGDASPVISYSRDGHPVTRAMT